MPLVAQHLTERERIGRGRQAIEIVERAHEGADPGVERGLEGRKINLPQGALGDFRGVVIAPAFGRAVGDPVFGASDDFVRLTVIRALKAADAGARQGAPRNGSSPAPSMIRPQRGSRAMSTMGAKVQRTPAEAASAAAMLAARSAAAGSHAAASPSGTGKMVR